MRNIGLDLLRLVAVVLVIGRHLRLPASCPTTVRKVLEGGWIGVDLFFVLSGFLVSSLLFREYQKNGAVNIKRFLIRRAFKIYPAFWLFLSVSCITMLLLGIPIAKRQVAGEIFFLQNYLGGVWDHTWSLAVEEHFYIGLAILVLLLIRFRKDTPFAAVPKVFIFIAITCLGFRLLNLVMYPIYSHRAYLFGTHIRVDSLMFGVLISYYWNFRNLPSRISRIPASILFITGAVLLIPAMIFQLESNKWIPIFGVILFYVGSGCLLLSAIRFERSSSIVVQSLASLGASSYSIYLWHMPVSVWGYKLVCRLVGQDLYWVYVFNAVIVACGFGWFLNRLIEKPVLALRDLLFPSRINAVTSEVRGVETAHGFGEQSTITHEV